MKSKNLGWLALLVAGWLVFQDGIEIPNIDIPWKKPEQAQTVIPTPSSEFQQAVKPLIGDVKNAEDRRDLAGLYHGIAEVIRSDSQVITTTAQAAAMNQRAGTLLLQVKGKSLNSISPTIQEKLEESMKVMMTMANQNLTPDLRDKAANAFDAIAWAFQQ